MTKSDEERGILTARVIQLREDVRQLKESELKENDYRIAEWMFLFGKKPNGMITEIVPTADSWCGRTSSTLAAFKENFRKWSWLMAGLMVANMLTEHLSKANLEMIWKALDLAAK